MAGKEVPPRYDRSTRHPHHPHRQKNAILLLAEPTRAITSSLYHRALLYFPALLATVTTPPSLWPHLRSQGECLSCLSVPLSRLLPPPTTLYRYQIISVSEVSVGVGLSHVTTQPNSGPSPAAQCCTLKAMATGSSARTIFDRARSAPGSPGIPHTQPHSSMIHETPKLDTCGHYGLAKPLSHTPFRSSTPDTPLVTGRTPARSRSEGEPA